MITPSSSKHALIPKGTRVMVLKYDSDEMANRSAHYQLAEILSSRHVANTEMSENSPSSGVLYPDRNNQNFLYIEYYVHYVDYNKRLDEWVTEDRLDKSTMLTPQQLTSQHSGLSKSAGASKGATAQKTVHKTPTKKKNASIGARKKTSVGRVITEITESPSTVTEDSMMSVVVEQRAQDEQLVQQVSESTKGPSVITAPLTYEQEIEQLRHGGSMTRRHEELSRVKNIDYVELGRHVLECWYFSPYPAELINTNGPTTVYLCEFCLDWHIDRACLKRHCQKCQIRCPPGTEIARQGNLSLFELDGHKQKNWTRRLCLLSKLFLDHKTLFYDVDPFLYYVLTENDSVGSHLIGYFSKEKDSADGYNVACILTLPQYQRRGYGRLLIEISYELSRREGKVGSPEKPLSDLGLLGYLSYWSEVLVSILLEAVDSCQEVSIDSMSKRTGFTTADIQLTLQYLDVIRYNKGQHFVVLSEKVLDEWKKGQEKIKVRFDPKTLHWSPPIFAPSQLRFL